MNYPLVPINQRGQLSGVAQLMTWWLLQKYRGTFAQKLKIGDGQFLTYFMMEPEKENVRENFAANLNGSYGEEYIHSYK